MKYLFGLGISKVKSILLVGSSIFEQWSNAQSAAPNDNVINKAVGGTVTSYWLEHLNAELELEKPDVVCFYCGSNDFNHDIPTEEIVANTFACRQLILDFSEVTKFAYFSIMKAPQKLSKWMLINKVNTAIRDGLQAEDLYLEWNNVIFGDKPAIKDYFVEDGLHLTDSAYKDLSAYVRPIMTQWMNR